MSSRFFIFWMTIILNIGFTASAQKVGLVLSGGGSKGIAHIGVIRALEDNGIPIDYITGTSMGAIIGGLYAAGYSPDEMEEIVTSKDFSYWVSGELGVEYTYFFKQEEPNPSWINLRFNYDSVLTTNILPTNLVSPQQMDYAFMKYFSGATALAKGDFDHLLIPFRCVASDVATKKQAVLKSGDLGRAIRASMTFPFYFRPIMIDRKLMFDGGMYNNFPTDVMLDEFYPDIIIGSKVAGNYGPPKNNDILSQLQSMLMVDSKYDVPCDNGVLIEPKLKEVNVVDFSHSREFIDSGYVATLRMIPEIRKFQTLYVTQETMSAKRKAFRDSIPPLNIGSIYVNGLKKNQSEYVRWHLFHKEPTVPIEKMKPDYFKLLSDNQISYIFPTLKYNPIHKWYDLHLDVEKENNINVQFGGTISTSPVNEAFLGLRYKRLAKSAAVYRANIYIGRIFSSAEFGARWDFPFTIPNYLDMVLGFNQWDYFKTSTYFFVDKTPSYLIQKELKVEINYGVPYGRTSKFEFGAAVASLRDDYYQLNEFTRSDIADKTYFDLITPKVSYEANTLNDKQFANQGSRFFGDIHYVNGTEKNVPGTTSITDSSTSVHQDWFQLRMDYDNYYKKLGKLKLGFYSELMLSNKKLYNNYTSSLLSSGVFAPFAYARIIFMPEFRANSFMAVGLKNVYMISKSFDFRLEGYAFRPFSQIIKIGNNMAAYDNKSPGIKYMATSAFVFHSPIGPASLSVNWFDRNQDRFSFGFTIGYIIFNKRVLD